MTAADDNDLARRVVEAIEGLLDRREFDQAAMVAAQDAVRTAEARMNATLEVAVRSVRVETFEEFAEAWRELCRQVARFFDLLGLHDDADLQYARAGWSTLTVLEQSVIQGRFDEMVQDLR